ncbi:MAG: SDR family oxidoreductase [Planctomycetaceae bacterium]|nr:SDR family oxidoreductase [Planctomycetaceae bacterium]
MTKDSENSSSAAGNGCAGVSIGLQGRVALVTGNSTGLGKAIGLALGRAGAVVPVNFFNNEARAQQALAEYQAAGIRTMLVKADVTKPEDVNQMVSEIESKYGTIDILVPNATCEQPLRPIEEYDWEFYQLMLDFFVKSPYLLTRRTLPAMKQKRFGRIINITSEVFHRAVSPFSAYVAAKGAQIGWSRSMSQELAPFGITVNMVAPGWIPVERHLNDPEADKQRYFDLIPAKRWGVPEDVANTVLYLASEQSGFVTGQSIAVNGGMTAWL